MMPPLHQLLDILRRCVLRPLLTPSTVYDDTYDAALEWLVSQNLLIRTNAKCPKSEMEDRLARMPRSATWSKRPDTQSHVADDGPTSEHGPRHHFRPHQPSGSEIYPQLIQENIRTQLSMPKPYTSWECCYCGQILSVGDGRICSCQHKQCSECRSMDGIYHRHTFSGEALPPPFEHRGNHQSAILQSSDEAPYRRYHHHHYKKLSSNSSARNIQNTPGSRRRLPAHSPPRHRHSSPDPPQASSQPTLDEARKQRGTDLVSLHGYKFTAQMPETWGDIDG